MKRHSQSALPDEVWKLIDFLFWTRLDCLPGSSGDGVEPHFIETTKRGVEIWGRISFLPKCEFYELHLCLPRLYFSNLASVTPEAVSKAAITEACLDDKTLRATATISSATSHASRTTMRRTIIVHVATKDLQRARAFYTALGFAPNDQLSGETCVCLVISDTIQLMLSEESTFATFSPRAVCDTSTHLEVLNCLSCSSRDQVDDLVRKAVEAGGSTCEEAEDHGFMYQHSFLDPDGHGWNLFHMVEPA